MPLQVNAESLPSIHKQPATNRTPLLLVESIGHRFGHDPVFPPFTGKLIPVCCPTKQMSTSPQSPPERRHGIANRRKQPGWITGI